MLFYTHASVVEWSITTDCKSVAFGLRRFESYPAHRIHLDGGTRVRDFYRALYFAFFVLDHKFATPESYDYFVAFFDTVRDNIRRDRVQDFVLNKTVEWPRTVMRVVTLFREMC